MIRSFSAGPLLGNTGSLLWEFSGCRLSVNARWPLRCAPRMSRGHRRIKITEYNLDAPSQRIIAVRGDLSNQRLQAGASRRLHSQHTDAGRCNILPVLGADLTASPGQPVRRILLRCWQNDEQRPHAISQLLVLRAAEVINHWVPLIFRASKSRPHDETGWLCGLTKCLRRCGQESRWSRSPTCRHAQTAAACVLAQGSWRAGPQTARCRDS